jgi:RNA polymerase sigma-70 factor (ECF subfamily)
LSGAVAAARIDADLVLSQRQALPLADPSSRSLLIQDLIDRLRGGDESARGELIRCSVDRLAALVRRMLNRYERIRRWEQTDDVVQNVSMRLYRTLEHVTPESTRDFFRLASLNIRRELLDLAKHYYGPQGLGTLYASRPDGTTQSNRPAGGNEPSDATHDPNRLEAWAEFHRHVSALPEELREVFDLIWYQGLTRTEAAGIIGISERTLMRRWQEARLAIFDALDGQLPPVD